MRQRPEPLFKPRAGVRHDGGVEVSLPFLLSASFGLILHYERTGSLSYKDIFLYRRMIQSSSETIKSPFQGPTCRNVIRPKFREALHHIRPVCEQNAGKQALVQHRSLSPDLNVAQLDRQHDIRQDVDIQGRLRGPIYTPCPTYNEAPRICGTYQRRPLSCPITRRPVILISPSGCAMAFSGYFRLTSGRFCR